MQFHDLNVRMLRPMSKAILCSKNWLPKLEAPRTWAISFKQCMAIKSWVNEEKHHFLLRVTWKLTRNN